jgi:quercetin dioxygenase-like cupin family protein
MILRLSPLAASLHGRLIPMSRPHDSVVGDEDSPYMLRWRMGRKNPVLNAFVHKFLRPDEEGALHDHPWPSASLMLSGAVFEHVRTRNGEQVRHLRAGDLVFRGPRLAHRLSPDPTVPGDCWSLFLTGPKVREWGFHCATGWRPWQAYIADREDGSRRGCE